DVGLGADKNHEARVLFGIRFKRFPGRPAPKIGPHVTQVERPPALCGRAELIKRRSALQTDWFLRIAWRFYPRRFTAGLFPPRRVADNDHHGRGSLDSIRAFACLL